MLNPKLLKAIWAVARERGLSHEEVHDAIYAGWKKTSVKDLSDFEAHRLLDGMRGKKRGGISYDRGQAMAYAGRKQNAVDDPAFLINDTERQLLWKAAYSRGWNEDTLRTFCVRTIGVGEPRTMKEFNKVFWAIKAMQRRDERRRAAQGDPGPACPECGAPSLTSCACG